VSLIESETRHRLEVGTLARFGGHGLTWPAIMALTEGRRKKWWLVVIEEAEERGVLAWHRASLCWRLTDAGRELVRSVS